MRHRLHKCPLARGSEGRKLIVYILEKKKTKSIDWWLNLKFSFLSDCAQLSFSYIPFQPFWECCYEDEADFPCTCLLRQDKIFTMYGRLCCNKKGKQKEREVWYEFIHHRQNLLLWNMQLLIIRLAPARRWRGDALD